MKLKKYLILYVFVIQHLVTASLIYANDLQPKYGPKNSPNAIPLALSNEYFRNPKHPASSFWALISYYIPQTTGASCGTATLAMILNAARSQLNRSAKDAVITENTLWEKMKTDFEKRLPSDNKPLGAFGLTLDQLGRVTEAAFKVYQFNKIQVKVVHVQDKSPSTQIELIKALKTLSNKDFMIANFNQKAFTDDAEVGHFAPVGAYDEEKKRVLILDPDRGSGNLAGYYEPYWVSLETFLNGMATQDLFTQSNRGYITVKTGN